MNKETQKSIARIRIPVLQKLIKKYQKELKQHKKILNERIYSNN